MDRVIQGYRFCSVYLFRGRLFLAREEGVRGPRKSVFPPSELDRAIGAAHLGLEVRGALASYREASNPVYADEWEVLNQQLLEFFGEKSVASFERKKTSVTVREHAPTGEVRFFTPNESGVVLRGPSDEELGSTVQSLLGLPRS